MTGSISCPPARRTVSRRKMLAKWQRSPRWKALVEEHAHTPESVCVYCGRHHNQQWTNSKGEEKTVRLTINHKDRALYLTEDLYCTWNPEKMEITCLACNRLFEQGRKPCPECLKEGRYRPIRWNDEECEECYFRKHPEAAKLAEEGRRKFTEGVRQANAARADRQRKAKVRHPCRYRMVSGRCQLSKIGTRCTFSPSKALKRCGDAEAKKGAMA